MGLFLKVRAGRGVNRKTRSHARSGVVKALPRCAGGAIARRSGARGRPRAIADCAALRPISRSA
jgi:hypothetical protein